MRTPWRCIAVTNHLGLTLKATSIGRTFSFSCRVAGSHLQDDVFGLRGQPIRGRWQAQGERVAGSSLLLHTAPPATRGLHQGWNAGKVLRLKPSPLEIFKAAIREDQRLFGEKNSLRKLGGNEGSRSGAS